MARALINVPDERQARRDRSRSRRSSRHPMETGYRRGPSGEAIARDIINRFVCTYDGEEIFRAELFPAVAANPFIAFSTVATQSGELAFSWTDDAGHSQTETVKITVA